MGLSELLELCVEREFQPPRENDRNSDSIMSGDVMSVLNVPLLARFENAESDAARSALKVCPARLQRVRKSIKLC